MPVEFEVEVFPVGQERFHAVDKVLMRHAFDMHNALGRFFDERIYQDELAMRCMDCGIEAKREVEIRVVYQSFHKSFYLDILVEGGLIYELKAVEALNAAHQKQLIHYLLLTGLNHGKLVNLRPSSVESRFVSTRLNRIERMAYVLDEEFWKGEDEQSQNLKNTLQKLLDDWGAFLEASLYRDALLHFLCDGETGIQPVDIEVNGRIIGTQKVCLLNSNTAWHLSAARLHLPSYERHLTRLLNHTRLEQIHWINLNQRQITLKTLKK